MEGMNVACPVCTLYLRPGITLENHLTSHPKQKVIEALIRFTQLCPQAAEKPDCGGGPPSSEMTVFNPVNLNQMPTNHSFIYQQFMSSSGTQPLINMGPMNQQFVAVPTVFNPQQMVCPPYIFQQQQQVQIVSSMPTLIPRPQPEMLPNSGATVCSAVVTEVEDPLNTTTASKNVSATLSEDSALPEAPALSRAPTFNGTPTLSVSSALNATPVQTFGTQFVPSEQNTSEGKSTKTGKAKIETVHAPGEDNRTVIDTEEEKNVLQEAKEEELSINHSTGNLTESAEKCDVIESEGEAEDEEILSTVVCEEASPVSQKREEWDVKEDDELNKACQTTQTIIEKEIGEIVLIAGEPKSEHFTSTSQYSHQPENAEINIVSSHLENNNNVTVLELDDINFILPNDFMQNGPAVVSKVDHLECLEENREEGIEIGEEAVEPTKILINMDSEKFIIGNFGKDDKFEDCLSRESLNIRADERMPPRGELSEQESNGASEVGWGSRLYQEGSSGMSSSYDLIARESWEASDYSDSETPQGRIPRLHSPVSQPLDLGEDQQSHDLKEEEEVEKKPAIFFSCSTCGAVFRCPKERRVHQAKEHASYPPENEASSSYSNCRAVDSFPSSPCPVQPSSSSSSSCNKRSKRRPVRKSSKCSKPDVIVKMEPKVEPDNQEDTKIEEDSRLDGSPFDEDALRSSTKGSRRLNLEGSNKLERAPLEKVTKEVLCNVCGVMLSSLKELNLHCKKMHDMPLIISNRTCGTCGKGFTSSREYTEHLKEHPLECNICGKHFYRIPNMRLHMRRHLGIRPYRCQTCSKNFLTKQKLKEHLNVHTGDLPVKCNLCDESFRRYSNMVQHRNRHHLAHKRKSRDYICHCGEIFHTKNKYNWHKEVHEAKPKSCIYCYEKFIHRASLTRHIRRAHNQRYVPEKTREAENVECKICKGVYLKSSLDAHLSIHSGKKQYSCTICHKEFSTKWNLKLHKWTHAAPTSKPFRCDICQSAFIRKSDYVSHMNSHRSIRPYTCNYCGCKFIRKYNCLRHVREHEEGKSFTCDVCNKSFHRSYYLKEHMRVHSGVRPYSCHICGKTSTTKSNHNKHMKIHHAREPVMTEG